MIDALKPYPAMKDPGVPWLGEVPEHWCVRRFKYLLRERDVRSSEGTEQLLRVSQFTGVTERKRPDGGVEPDTRAESLIGYKCVEQNDLVVNIMLAWNGSMGISRYPGIASPAYCVFRFSASAQPWYFHYLLRSPRYKARIKAVSTGVVESRLRLYSDDLYRLEGLLPPEPEQAAIVRFLDHADRKIRRYIRAKQKLIKLLEEQKQAIIHRAVTRGLDPNVRLKSSGVEWLGDVPEHWEINQVRSIAQVVRGGSPRPAGSSLYFHGSGAPWITVGEVTRAKGKYVTTTKTRLTPAGEGRSRMIEPGTLLLTNSGATLGIPKISAIRGCINDGVAALLNIKPRICKNFLLYFLETQTLHLKAWVDLGAQPNLNTQIIGGWPVPIPSPEEQAAIVSLIENSTAFMADAVSRAKREILLFDEYRTRLIADVVSGKLDVREAAAQLPDEDQQLPPIDESDGISEGEEDEPDDLDVAPLEDPET